jgi:hypothetical protein
VRVRGLEAWMEIGLEQVGVLVVGVVGGSEIEDAIQ